MTSADPFHTPVPLPSPAAASAAASAPPPLAVCVLVAAFNEAPTIAAVVSGAHTYLRDVVVIDDGSSDETAGRAEAAGATVLSHPQNRGKGYAVRTGIAYALARSFTHILLMDGDLQHRPSDIPKLLDAARSPDIDLVVGERIFDKTQMPSSRYYSNVIGSRALSGFIGSEIRDSQSGYRLIRCDALRNVTLTATGYEIETEILIKLARRHARMTSVPVELSYGAKSKLRPVRDTTRTCLLAVYYRFLSRD
jgi:glycosyltransferase involved in cell wall biosynthesis